MPSSLQGAENFIFYAICRLGHEAVMIFFVISGFLVCGRGLERIHNNSFDLNSYVVDRAVRIGLPLIAAIVLFFVVCQIIGIEFSWLTALGNLLSLQGIFVDSLVSPFWSLSFEVWFYVLLAGIALVFQEKRLGWFLFVLICLVFCKAEASYLLIWFLGGLAYIYRPKKGNVWLMLSFLFLMILSMVSMQLTTESKAMKNLVMSFDRTVLEMIFAMFVALFIQQVILF